MAELSPDAMLKRSIVVIKNLEDEIAQLKTKSEEPVAIVGMSCRFPGGANTIEDYWTLLSKGVDAISIVPISRWDADSFYDPDPETPGKMTTKWGGFLDIDVSLFDAEFFGINAREAEYLDPQQRLLLELSYEALESAFIEPASLQGTKTGVFIGISSHDYMDLINEIGDPGLISPYFGTGNSASTATGRISYVFDFQGPNIAIDTACSSSLVAIDQACESLRNGSSSLALAGGVNLILSPTISIDFSKAGMLAPDGRCKTFDAKADGYVRGEGGGIIILKRYKDALRDGNHIYGVIRSSGINQDGTSGGLTAPNGIAQEDLIKSVLAKAKLKGSDIDYVEAHGTGTSLGDPIEVRAIGSIYGIREGGSPLRLGAVKTNFGHLEAAAGMAGIIKCVLALQNETIPANLHFHHLNPQIEMNFPAEIVTRNSEWKRGERIRRAAVSSFGFSGTNAHLIIEEAPLQDHPAEKKIKKRHHFQRKRYWIEGARPGIGFKRNFVHPLLGEMRKNPNKTVSFYGELGLSALPYLKDHQVYDYSIFPGAGYLEMMLEGGKHALSEENIELKDVSIESALNIPASKAIETHVLMNPIETGYEAIVYAKAKEDSWTIHARGTILSNPSEEFLTIDIEALKSRLSPKNKEEFYVQVRSRGINYGKHFQTLENIYAGNREALGELKIPFSAKGYLAHPTLLDGCLQLLALSSTQSFMPVGIDSFKLYHPLEDHVIAHLQVTELTDEMCSGNVDIVNPEGKLLAKIQGVRCRKTTPQALKRMISQGFRLDDWMYETVWQEHKSEEFTLSNNLKNYLILGADAEDEQFKIMLESRGSKCVSVNFAKLPQSNEEYVALLEKENPDGVIHLAVASETLTSDSIRKAQECGTKSYLHLCQALIKLNRKTPVFLITYGKLVDSPINGLFKSVLLEHPELELKHIILGTNWDPHTLLDILNVKNDESILALREDKVFIPRVIRQIEAKAKRNELLRPADNLFKLQTNEKGLLENLAFVPLNVKDTLDPNEVEIEVYAVGLNFRDVLDASGELEFLKDSNPLGSDGSGIVTRIGNSVSNFRVGDKVLGLINGCLATKAYAPQETLALNNAGFTFEEAASLPTVFLTAYYAFNYATELRKDDIVLIHAAAGGVGQAAIQLAKLAGAKIIVTAGSPEKRAFLKSQGIDHVFDSRSLSFGEEIKKITSGRGVDVVLNCLSGVGFIETSLNICKEGARFLEIGKRNIWTKEAVQKYRSDIDYHIIALDEIAPAEPKLIEEILKKLMSLFEQGQLKPLPLTTFPIERSIQAFKYMQTGKHIGKIVISLPPQQKLENQIRPSATYLITGGQGGIGQVLAEFLFSKGARHIVLTGRKQQDNHLSIEGAEIRYETLDISDEKGVEDLIKRLTESRHPLKGVFHLAGVLHDAMVTAQDWSSFETVFSAKVYGSYYLHKYTKDLDYFIMFSSAASTFGSSGQSNYAAANAFMDSLSEYRREKGLPAQSLSWGLWSGAGLAKDFVSRHEKKGVLAINPKEGMRAFEAAILNNHTHTTIANMHWKLFFKHLISVPSWLQALEHHKVSKGQLSQQLESIEKSERLNCVKNYVSDTLKTVLGISSNRSIDENKGFASMGLDSMLAIELKNRLQAGIGREAVISTTAIFDFSTVDKLSHYIAQLIKLENIQLQKRQQPLIAPQEDEPIAIIGLSCRFPGGADNPEAFWDLLSRGGDGIREVPEDRWDADSFYDPDPSVPGKMISKLGGFLNIDVSFFDADFFGISPREAEYMDPQQRLLLELSYEAIESANLNPQTLKGSQTGVFIGICSHDYIDLLNQSSDKESLYPYMGTGNAASTATGRISFIFDFQGPNIAIDTACSSSLVAIEQACGSLRKGTSQLALAGGVNLILSPSLSINFSKAGMLSPDGHCKTFDASANGYVRGEGGGIIILKRYSEAVRDGNPILAVIKSIGVNQDGASSGLTVPNGEAQESLIRSVLAQAKLTGADIDYIEAHGTGTPLGDPIEIRAIGATYGDRHQANRLRIGSVKTNIGHLEASSGIAGVIKTVLALQHEVIPPHLHFNHLNPHIEMNFPAEINTKNYAWTRGERKRRAAVSSFGFSGTNAHLILEEPLSVSNPLKSFNLHQFHRKRYWAEALESVPARTMKAMHPLLGDMRKIPNDTISFYREWQLSKLPYLKDHQVFDSIIFPAAGYFEMMLAAGLHAFGDGVITVTNIGIESPLNLTDTKMIETQVLITPVDSENEVIIFTPENKDSWSCHAKGTVSVSNNVYDSNFKDIAEIQSHCNKRINKDEFYTKISSVGLYLGVNFQTLDNIYVGDQESLGEIKLSSSSKGYLAHPALLDGCLQLFAATLSEEILHLYLPVSCDSFTLFAPLGNHVFAHWQNVQVAEGMVSGNLNILSPEGKLLSTIKGFRGQRTSEQALQRMLSHKKRVDNFIYELIWQEHAFTTINQPDLNEKLLILGDNAIAKEFIKSIESKGKAYTNITQKNLPNTKEEYVALLENEKPSLILHVTHSEEDQTLTGNKLRAVQESGVKSFLHLTQGLIELNSKIPLFLVNTLNLANSPLNGLFKTILQEHPEIQLKQIELGRNWTLNQFQDVLYAQDEEPFVRLNEGKAYVPRLQRDTSSHGSDQSAIEDIIQPDASYLITGGLGGLGIVIAKWLIAKGVRHLILIGRGMDDLNLHQSAPFNSVDVTYKILDVSDEESVKNFLTELMNSENPLRGIFHLAGVIDDATLMVQDWSRFEAVFASKVYGSYYLHRYSNNLDFFVMFSSIASILGNAGQGNYAAANAFMDALCLFRKAQGLPALSLSWGPWEEVGMAKDLLLNYSGRGIIKINTENAIQALEIAFLKPKAHLIIADINWKQFLQAPHFPSLLKTFSQQKTDSKHLLKQLESVELGERIHFVKKYLISNVKEVLRISDSDSLDEKKGFYDMGFDSLMAVELKNRLQADLGKSIKLPLTLVLEYPSIEKLTKQLAILLKLTDNDLEISHDNRENQKIEQDVNESFSKEVEKMDLKNMVDFLTELGDGK